MMTTKRLIELALTAVLSEYEKVDEALDRYGENKVWQIRAEELWQEVKELESMLTSQREGAA